MAEAAGNAATVQTLPPLPTEANPTTSGPVIESPRAPAAAAFEEDDEWTIYKKSRGDLNALAHGAELTQLSSLKRINEQKLMAVLYSAAKDVIETDGNNTQRYSESEDGFYTGEPPSVVPDNLLRLERRLRIVDHAGKKHFAHDGRILRVADPLRSIAIRPSREPIKEHVMVLRLPPALRARFRLDIKIDRVQFTVHPYSLAEHGLAAQLLERLALHTRLSAKTDTSQLRQRIVALETQALSSENADAINNAIVQTRQQIVAIEAAAAERVHNIVGLWNKIKRVREAQGCTATRVNLVIRKPPDDDIPHPELRESDITAFDKCPPEEQLRRRTAETKQIYARLIVNDQVVGESPRYPMDASVNVNFNHTFQLQLVAWPNNIYIALYETAVCDLHLNM